MTAAQYSGYLRKSHALLISTKNSHEMSSSKGKQEDEEIQCVFKKGEWSSWEIGSAGSN